MLTKKGRILNCARRDLLLFLTVFGGCIPIIIILMGLSQSLTIET